MGLPLNATAWPPGASEMARRIREYDWAATLLGPIDGWPPSLRAVLGTVLASPFPSVLAWGPGFITLHNDAYLPLLGTKPDALGRPFLDVWAEARVTIAPLLERALAGEAFRFENARFTLLRSGRPEEAFFNYSLSPVLDETGAIVGVLNTGVETTAGHRARAARLRESEARHAFLLKLSDALRPLIDASHVKAKACRILGAELAADRVFLAELTRDGAERAVVDNDFHSTALPSVTGCYQLANFGLEVARMLRAGRTVVNPEIPAFDVTTRAEKAADGGVELAAQVMVPVVEAGQLVAVLGVDQEQPRAWTDSEIVLIEEAAERAWAALERAHAEAALRHSQARLSIIFAFAAVGLSEIALDGRFLQVNDELCRILGRTREEVLRLTIPEVTHPGDVPTSLEAVAQVIESGATASLDKRYLRPDGSEVWANSRVSLLRHGGGLPDTLLAVTADLTERHAAEAAVRRSEERLRAILETARDYAIFTTDAEGRIETWPKGAEAVFGWSAAEAVGLPVDVTFTSADREKGIPGEERRTAWEEGHAPDVRWHQRRNGTCVFIDGMMWPLTEADGSLTGFVKVGQDVTARRRAEERLQLATEATGLGIFDVDLTTGIIEWDTRLRELWGVGANLVITDEIFMTCVHPEDRDLVRAAVGQALDPAGDRVYRAEFRGLGRPNGHELWIAATGRVHFNGLRPVRLVGTVQDISERKAAEAALRESEARFREFGEASADVLWIRDAKTLRAEYLSPAFETVYGISREEALTGNQIKRWIGTIHPEDRTRALDHIRRVQEGESRTEGFRIVRRLDGQVRWIRHTAFPLRDAAGRVKRIGGVKRDVTAEVELQDRLQVLVTELQHRTRNLIGVVRSVADRTLAGSKTLDEFQDRFRDRLNALARVNGLLSRLHEGDRISFDELIRAELMGHGVLEPSGRGAQVRLQGPSGIRLRSATVQILALGIHELATNALKYGALSRPEGRLKVSWTLLPDKDGETRLQVQWRESGVPVPMSDPSQPARHGYGRELIERALPYQLKAQTAYDLTPEGVRCTITLPVSSAMMNAVSSQGGADA